MIPAMKKNWHSVCEHECETCHFYGQADETGELVFPCSRCSKADNGPLCLWLETTPTLYEQWRRIMDEMAEQGCLAFGGVPAEEAKLVPSLRDTENERLRAFIEKHAQEVVILEEARHSIYYQPNADIWELEETTKPAPDKPRKHVRCLESGTICDVLDAAEALLEKPEPELTEDELLLEIAREAAAGNLIFGLHENRPCIYSCDKEVSYYWRPRGAHKLFGSGLEKCGTTSNRSSAVARCY